MWLTLQLPPRQSSATVHNSKNEKTFQLHIKELKKFPFALPFRAAALESERNFWGLPLRNCATVGDQDWVTVPGSRKSNWNDGENCH